MTVEQPAPVVRAALATDAPTLAAIYAVFVRESYATFALAAPTVADWVRHIETADTGAGHHVLVAETGGIVAGYAYAAQFRSRPAYGRTVEVSIYLDRPGQGLGKALYAELFALLDRGPAHRAIASIALPNDASVALHERFGFRHAGTLTEVGYKLGAWRDVAYYERATRGGR